MEKTISVFSSKNPATGEVLGEVPIFTSEEIQEAVTKAREAQIEWSKLDVEERSEALRLLTPVILEKKDSTASLISKETGKPLLEALTGEILTVLESLEYAVENASKLFQPKKISHRILKTISTYQSYEPHGVVGMITPWNYPFLLSFGPAISALVAGNAVVIKPSEFTPMSVLEIKKIWDASGLPANLLQVVTGYGAAGEALVRSGVNKVSFTGSVATGRKVASLCGELLIPITLELGGKDPMIVLEDAPLERTVKGATWGSFCNSGQICASVERIYVEEGIYDHFVGLFQEEIKKLRQGNSSSHDTDIGPMSNERQFNIVHAQVEEALKKGAKALTGGKGTAPYFEPTLLVGVTSEMDVYEKESFGPIVNVFKVKNEEEAIRMANESPFGLTASIWTEDRERAKKIANQLKCGFVFVNDHLGASGAGEVSWGGVKESGFGRTRGPEGLLEMVKVKYVSIENADTTSAPYWYPYTEEKYQRFSEAIDQIYSKSFVSRLLGFLKLAWLTFR